MIYSVNFQEMAGRISHITLVKYLKELGWNEFNTKRAHVKIFQLKRSDKFYQIVVPTDRSLFDYDSAMFNAARTISETENRSVEQVILELINPIADILKIRISNPKNQMGSIFIEDAIKLYDNAKKLLTATALDIVLPKIIHGGRIDESVQKYINNCRFGQTEIGSYIVSVVCPFYDIENEDVNQLTLFAPEELCANSITRKVSNKLISSVSTVKNSIENGQFNTDYIVEKIENGKDDCISINFIDALKNMNIDDADTELSLSVDWAPTIKKNRLSYNTVNINHDYYEPLDAVVKEFKNEIDDEKSYTGRISKLESLADPEKRKNGTITLVYFTDNYSTARATVLLNESDYQQAIEAHKKGKLVKVIGKLTGGTHKKIENAVFQVLDS